VDGDSMIPSLINNEDMLVKRSATGFQDSTAGIWSFAFTGVHRKLRQARDRPAGVTVSVTDGLIYIDGTELRRKH
jgi:hypothetical protein